MSALRELIEEDEQRDRAEASPAAGIEPGDDGYGDQSRTDMMLALAAVQAQEKAGR